MYRTDNKKTNMTTCNIINNNNVLKLLKANYNHDTGTIIATIIATATATAMGMTISWSHLVCALPLLALFGALFVRRQRPPSQTNADAPMQRKLEFLSRVGNAYGYRNSPKGFIDTWRRHEFPPLLPPLLDNGCGSGCLQRFNFSTSTNRRNHQRNHDDDDDDDDPMVYLDYAGAGLPTKSQLLRAATLPILANPHSTGPSPSLLLLEQAKQRILAHFHATADYDILFTSGTTEALRIVAERFPWTRQSSFMYATNSHTSVVGMRECALAHGATVVAKSMADILHPPLTQQQQQQTTVTHWSDAVDSADEDTKHLLALPLECNFSGHRPDLSQLTSKLQHHQHWYTLLDIAKAASTSPVNLQELQPDFACLSFYKLFGAPTGLGALFVKKRATTMFRHSSYFGGGSVQVVLPHRALRKPGLVAHGTMHFRGMATLAHGWDELDAVGGMLAIQAHASCLARELVRRWTLLRHSNGTPVVEFYSSMDAGSIVTFNIVQSDGSYVGYNEVHKLAALQSIQLRTGCFCNPGACQEALRLTDSDIHDHHTVAGHVCGDHMDIIHGRPTGAVRISLGKESLWEDIDYVASFVERMFVSTTDVVDDPLTVTTTTTITSEQDVPLTELYIFPIKSCAAQRVSKWRIIMGRLEFDREFALVDSSGTAMRLQNYPQMSQIRPTIDNVIHQIMTVSAPGMPDLVLDLKEKPASDPSVISVCGNQCGGQVWSTSDWFSNFLGVQCWLARYGGPQRGVAFANEESLLLISEQAVEKLNLVLKRQGQAPVETRHFRPNLVIRSLTDGDQWKSLTLPNSTSLEVVGDCPRCSMVDVDPTSGEKGKTLRALAEYRRRKGRIVFGIFLRAPVDSTTDVWIQQGDLLTCTA
jgi:molybdenum cofactor sulfurtransferase